MEEINEKPLEVLEQNAKALDELVEDKAENQLDPNEDMEIVEPPEEEEVDIDDEKPLVDIWKLLKHSILKEQNFPQFIEYKLQYNYFLRIFFLNYHIMKTLL